MSGKHGIKPGDTVKTEVLDREFTAEVKRVKRVHAYGNQYVVVIDLPEWVHDEVRFDQEWPVEWCEKVSEED